MAEGEGVEPLALLRCQRLLSKQFADHPAPPSVRCNLVEGAGIEPAGPYLGAARLATGCIATLPTFRDYTDDRDRLIGRRAKNMSGILA